MFRDNDDRLFFLELLQKHLAEYEDPDNPVLVFQVKVVAYCLMGTHFHLLLYQDIDIDAITGYMRSIGTTYSMYYNKKYKSKGHVFQSTYRASHVSSEPYLAHITRYIHLNPRSYVSWKWSSYRRYVDDSDEDWVHPELVLGENELGEAYAKFVADHANIDRRKQATELSEHIVF